MSSGSDTSLEAPSEAVASERAAALPTPPPEASDQPPVRVDGYVLEGLLGSGALGKSFRAREEGNEQGRPLVLKLLHAELAADASFKRRLLREVEAASKLEHPHIARVLKHGEDATEGTFICRELIEGDDLLTAARRDSLTPRRICELFGQLLSALSEAHRNGVLHRNLKPSNVLVVREADGRESVKVCDFGNPLRIRAAAEYMAPEQGGGLSIDGRADVYAVGVMLYELLTDAVPFHGGTPEETVGLHQTEALLSPRERRPDAALPRELETVCIKALAKDPRERHRSPREMSQALRAVVALLGMRADEPLGSSAFAEGDLAMASLERTTIPGEQLRSRTKFWLGAALLAAVCAAVLLNPEAEPVPERTDRPSVHASRADMAHGVRELSRGMEQLRNGDAKSAVVELRSARRSLGDTPEVLRALGEALVVDGKREEGVALLSRYLELEPNARDRSFVESLVRSGPAEPAPRAP